MSARDGYSPVETLQSPTQRSSWRRRAPRLVLAAAVAGGLVVIAAHATLSRAQHPGSSAVDVVAEELQLFESPSWIDTLSGASRKACQGASGFLHLSVCATATETTSTTSRTQTTTSTGSTTTTTTRTP